MWKELLKGFKYTPMWPVIIDVQMAGWVLQVTSIYGALFTLGR